MEYMNEAPTLKDIFGQHQKGEYFGWRYFRGTKNHEYVFLYSCKKPGGWYHVLQYRFIKKSNAWRLQKDRRYRKRWMAKDKAYAWYCEKNDRKFHSLHKVSEARKAQGKHLQAVLKQKNKEKAEMADEIEQAKAADNVMAALQAGIKLSPIALPSSDEVEEYSKKAYQDPAEITLERKATHLKHLATSGALAFLGVNAEIIIGIDMILVHGDSAPQSKKDWLDSVYTSLCKLVTEFEKVREAKMKE